MGDLDNDGRQDVLILSHNQPLAYFHNRTKGGRSLTLRLEGRGSNRDAVGARVTVVSAGRRLVAWRTGGGSYQSASDPRLHFGLGDSPRAESIEVAWPSGHVDRFAGVNAGAAYLLREGSGQAMPLQGFPTGDRRQPPLTRAAAHVARLVRSGLDQPERRTDRTDSDPGPPSLAAFRARDCTNYPRLVTTRMESRDVDAILMSWSPKPSARSSEKRELAKLIRLRFHRRNRRSAHPPRQPSSISPRFSRRLIKQIKAEMSYTLIGDGAPAL